MKGLIPQGNAKKCRRALFVFWAALGTIFVYLFSQGNSVALFNPSRGLASLEAAKERFFNSFQGPIPSEIAQEQWEPDDVEPWADPLDEQARIGKVTMLYGSLDPVYERALRTHKVHNRINGYPMFIHRHEILDGKWTMYAALQSILLRELSKPESQRLQWLFWFDADTVVLNYHVPLETFLPPEGDRNTDDINVLVAKDWNGINDGALALRVSPRNVELIASVLAFRDFRPDVPLRYKEQSAFEKVLDHPKFARYWVAVPQLWFNAYASDLSIPDESKVRPGDFLVHFAGVDAIAGGTRNARMRDWCEISEQYSPDWNDLPSQNGTLSEMQEFWDKVKRDRANMPA